MLLMINNIEVNLRKMLTNFFTIYIARVVSGFILLSDMQIGGVSVTEKIVDPEHWYC
jgi:hypothetical protein